MLARRIDKEGLVTILDTDSVTKVYELFLKNEKVKYLVVINEEGKPEGLIYREAVKGIEKAVCVKDFYTKRMITTDNNKTMVEIDRMIFALAKENINEVIILDQDGGLDGIWEKIINDCSDFYEKFIFIKQAGYSITDWINCYYGENAIIGIHSYSEYTELLLNEIHNTGIKVKFICQNGGNARGAWGNLCEKTFSNITIDELSSCDVVINTFMSLKHQVSYLYSKHKNYKNVVSMYDVVSELYSYERDAGYMLRVANMIAHSGRKVYIFDYPRLDKQNVRTDRENMMIRNGINVTKLRQMVGDNSEKDKFDTKKLIMPALNKSRKKYGMDEVSYENFINLYPSFSDASNAHIRYVGDSVRMYDLESPYVNIKNGIRVSLPPLADIDDSKFTNIHFFGKSWIYGHHCADEFTIPSFVQRISNEKHLNYHVFNHAIPGIREDKIANLMYEQDGILPRDDVFVLVHMFEDYGNQFNEKVAREAGYIHLLSSDRPHDYGEIWVDSGHIGEDGTELLARQVVDYITGNAKTVPGIFHNKFNPAAGREIYQYKVEDQASLWAEIPEFKDYQKYIAQYKQRIGSIVMNCNPFTLGHRYLIETAAAQCDRLYIFVVEEDKSIFAFEDRLKLVKEGVRDLDNVTVLHSGNFIISALTFPGYFHKSVDNTVSVDTSDDVTLFARYIAPTLGITIRFAGEEPLDYITRQYNKTMKEILPKYGVAFVEIPRKIWGGVVISASRVRQLLRNEDFEEISKMVPQTTLEFLLLNKERFCKGED